MFYHNKRLQYFTPPERPDPVYAMKMQELIGGAYGEMTVMMQYLFQGWNCRGPAKYRDMLLDIGTEEIGHVEMLATMIAHLLDKAPIRLQEEGAKDPIVGAVMGVNSRQYDYGYHGSGYEPPALNCFRSGRSTPGQRWLPLERSLRYC